MNKVMILIFTIMILITFNGCSRVPSEVGDKNIKDSSENIPAIDLIAYLVNDEDDISAHILSINTLDATINLSPAELFKVSGDLGWLDRIYPLNLSINSLALPYEPLEESVINFSVAATDELYFEDYILFYDTEESRAEIKIDNQAIATIPLMLDGIRLVPQSFFIDDDKIAVLSKTEGDTFDKVNIVSLIYVMRGNDLELETVNDHRSLFDDYGLSKNNMPNFTRLETNVYGNIESKTFLWNEGANIVEINPYDGTVKIILTVNNIKSDMPNLDTHRDFLEFFTGIGYQNNTYIAKFPNYNDLAGTISVFYGNAVEFLGSVLCTENYISLSNKENIEVSRIENTELIPFSFIPQGKLN